MKSIIIKEVKLLSIIEIIKKLLKKARNMYKNLAKEEKELKRQYSRNRYYKLKQQYKG